MDPADDQLELFPVDREIEADLANSLDKLVEAFAQSNKGYSVDRLVADPKLNRDFQQACDELTVPGLPVDRNRYLFRIRKSGKLKIYGIKTNEPTRIDWNEIDSFVFASEIAWRKIRDRHNVSLDEIFCDPDLAKKFDRMGTELAPGVSKLELRWAALKIRKESSNARKRAKSKSAKQLGIEKFKKMNFPKSDGLSIGEVLSMPPIHEPAAYVIVNDDSAPLYAGETNDFSSRMNATFGKRDAKKIWLAKARSVTIHHVNLKSVADLKLARQAQLVQWLVPEWNMVKEFLAEK